MCWWFQYKKKNNNNESFNQLVRKISPTTLNSISIIIEIPAYVALCVFNECTLALLIVINALGINCGPSVQRTIR